MDKVFGSEFQSLDYIKFNEIIVLMILFLQINCFNEERDLPKVIKKLPNKIPGISKIVILVVDDGSSDATSKVAKEFKAVHVIRHNSNRGLPQAVNTGMLYALKNKADLLVNLDADGQYPESAIPQLIQPLLENKADYVYGERQFHLISHFSATKKFLQYFGAFVVSLVINKKITDAASGFRALNRESLKRLYLLSDYASPLESLIQAKMKKLGITIIPIVPRETKRPSRLVKSIWKYVAKSSGIILDNLIIYRPLQIFLSFGILLTSFGFVTGTIRYWLVRNYPDNNRLTLLLISIAAIIIGTQSIFFGFIARVYRANRLLSEELIYRQSDSYEN